MALDAEHMCLREIRAIVLSKAYFTRNSSPCKEEF
jgi:hypothetical protein